MSSWIPRSTRDTKGAPLVTGVELRDRVGRRYQETNREFERFTLYEAREETIVDMIRHETAKYGSTIDKGKRLVASLAQRYRGQSFPREELVKLYDSHGVPPEIVAAVGNKIGTNVELPDDFYSIVADTHERVEVRVAPATEGVLDLPATHRLFYDEPEQVTFQAQVIGLSKGGVILIERFSIPAVGDSRKTRAISPQAWERKFEC